MKQSIRGIAAMVHYRRISAPAPKQRDSAVAMLKAGCEWPPAVASGQVLEAIFVEAVEAGFGKSSPAPKHPFVQGTHAHYIVHVVFEMDGSMRPCCRNN